MHRKRYKTMGLGGTFDHFHAGHQQFILFAANLAEELTIGVTHPQMTRQKPWAATIESYEARRNNVKHFCGMHHIRCRVTELTDIYGPTLVDSPVQALAVTAETVPGAKKINQMRTHLGLRDLPVFVSEYFLDESGQPLHAEAIRAGLVNRRGVVYGRYLQQSLILTDEQRQLFSQPQGDIINVANLVKRHQTPVIAVVGDKSLETFITNQWPYDLGVFDQRQLRQPVTSSVLDPLAAAATPTLTAANPAGTISAEMVTVLTQALTQQTQHVLIQGEEDLAAVALILLLPLESEVYYGQPGQGIVRMKVTEELKDKTFKALITTEP